MIAGIKSTSLGILTQPPPVPKRSGHFINFQSTDTRLAGMFTGVTAHKAALAQATQVTAHTYVCPAQCKGASWRRKWSRFRPETRFSGLVISQEGRPAPGASSRSHADAACTSEGPRPAPCPRQGLSTGQNGSSLTSQAAGAVETAHLDEQGSRGGGFLLFPQAAELTWHPPLRNHPTDTC